ncbi:hypothetical protein BDN72DRAFT_767747 [Pluteus cervinus]|uniref:Uncharacterized protein n=1 Tax=Pluteus cervinus TaxID=181527 RepID=A0ACD3AVE8_9AGAR|nr:hypothetical protein BDN72DRAFT_767747 [Pluteus cervinus]
MRVDAVPISAGPATAPTALHTIVFGPQPRAGCTGMDVRTTYEIVRSCFITIAACVYRAVHQNIPDPSLSFWGRLRVTAKVSFYALIAPEMMIWWAMRQWFGARDVMRLANYAEPRLKWTHTHGQFAQMGGFAWIGDKRVLYPWTLLKLLRDGYVDFEELNVTEKEIQDKSKGDILSKGLVAFQTTWFVFECMARLHQGLPLIELEVVTLAFATLNIITYGLWWYKPLNVLCPIYINLQRPAELRNPPTSANPDPPSPAPGEPDSREQSRVAEEIAISTEEPSASRLSDQPRTPNPLTESNVPPEVGDASNPEERGIIQVAKWKVALWKAVDTLKRGMRACSKAVWTQLIKKLFVLVAWPLWEMIYEEANYPKRTHVGTFYGFWNLRQDKVLVQGISSFIGMIFGAIHFLSWHSTFPTHIELILWRVSSVALAVVPTCMFLRTLLFRIWFATQAGTRQARITQMGWYVLECITLYPGCILYILARFCVLVLAFLTLHDLPLDALSNISWTTYIPHL